MDQSGFLATALARPWERWAALALGLLLLVAGAATVPFAAVPGPVIPGFIPAYDTALVIGDAIIALLLFAQFHQLRRPGLLVLGCGYLFTAGMVLAHMLSFPGLAGPAGIGGGSQTTVWLYVVWHGLFPLFTIAYAVLAARPGQDADGAELARPSATMAAGIAATAALVMGCVLLATAGHDHLPVLMDADRYRPGVTRPVLLLPWLATLLAFGILVRCTRVRRILDLWLAVVLGAWLVEILLSALLNSGRYQVGFYVGRLYGLLAAACVLAALLAETVALYARLARTLVETRAQAEELARTQASLQQMQRLEAIGQLTGGVAHDFNNLLTVITASLDMILQQPADPVRVRRLAETALRGASRGQRLTRQLLTFARRHVTHPETVNPNRLITELQGLLHRAAGAGVEIIARLSAVLDPAKLDPAEFEAALLNLVVNARDAMDGSGRITIETENIEFGTTAPNPEIVPGRYVVVAVTDTGTGMAPDVQARAFDPFFTTKEPGRGSGLGLSQVYGFAKSAGGHVQIDSREGAGTTVRLYLPRSADAPNRPQPRPGATPLRPASGNEAILVVEDDAEVSALVVENLEALGYHVLSAGDARQALEILRSAANIDLLFSDVVMPGGMNGAQLAIEARRLRPSLKVLLTSGYTASALSREHGVPGDLDLLGKPYRRDELASKLRLVISG